MRKLLFESLIRSTLTEARPDPDMSMIADLAGQLGSVARQRLGRSLSLLSQHRGGNTGRESK